MLDTINKSKFCKVPLAEVEAGKEYHVYVSDTQHTHDTQEAQPAQHTQGKKGQKHPRINMAFPADHLDYLQVISRIEGVSITEYVNRLVAADLITRQEEVERFKAMLKWAK